MYVNVYITKSKSKLLGAPVECLDQVVDKVRIAVMVANFREKLAPEVEGP